MVTAPLAHQQHRHLIRSLMSSEVALRLAWLVGTWHFSRIPCPTTGIVGPEIDDDVGGAARSRAMCRVCVDLGIQSTPQLLSEVTWHCSARWSGPKYLVTSSPPGACGLWLPQLKRGLSCPVVVDFVCCRTPQLVCLPSKGLQQPLESSGHPTNLIPFPISAFPSVTVAHALRGSSNFLHPVCLKRCLPA